MHACFERGCSGEAWPSAPQGPGGAEGARRDREGPKGPGRAEGAKGTRRGQGHNVSFKTEAISKTRPFQVKIPYQPSQFNGGPAKGHKL